MLTLIHLLQIYTIFLNNWHFNYLINCICFAVTLPPSFRSSIRPETCQVCRENVPGLLKPGGPAAVIGHSGHTMEQVYSISAGQ